MVDCTNAELAVEHALDYLITRCAEELYEHYLDEKVVPFSLEMLLGVLCGGLELEFQRRDPGESTAFPPDPDLVPNATDSWARTHISVRKVVRATVEPVVPTIATPISMDARSVQSLSQRSLMRKTTNSVLGAGKQSDRPKPYILESALEVPEPDLDVLRAKKEVEIQQRKAEAERERRWRQQREEEARRLERMASDLRKSNFTYDYDGKIVITKSRPLPSPSYVQYALAGLHSPPPPQKMKTTVSPKHASASAAAAKKPVQVAKKAPVAEQQFVKIMNSTPNIMELLKVSTGVTAIESNRSKRGPDFKSKTMTREEYKRLTATEEEEREYQESHLNMGKSPGGKKRQRASAVKKFLSEIPDSDREEEPLVTASLPALPPADYLSPVDHFNLQILRSSDWGMNTGKGSPVSTSPLPAKPTAREERAVHGIRPKKPRDRPFVDKKPVHERLPQPPLGKTMGHGLLE